MYQKSTKITTVIHFKKPLQSETKLLRHGVFKWGLRRGKQAIPLPLSSIQSWGLCCFLPEARTAVQYCMKGLEKAFISFINLQLAKRQKGRRFKAKCLN